MQWKLNVSNVGDFEFNGMILCDLNGDGFYSEEKSIEMNSSIDIILETYPVKGVLTCSHNGTRTTQTTISNITIDLESAFFLTRWLTGTGFGWWTMARRRYCVSIDVGKK